MLARMIIAAALVASVPVAAEPASPARAAPRERLTAATMVERMRPHLPLQFSGGFVVRGVRAEGDLVIMSVEVPANWTAQGIAVFTNGFTAGFCRRESPFFDIGLSIRIDTFSGDAEPTAGQVISGCPAR